ncbi:PREDICTED: homeobox protein siamois-like [Nanorana parkeri]|uniref:homeobox protein siamois-like n=1 Tax=Nanorana parkeri TaxID=125878 RepID=UPI00085507A9|nr:PREDICTED: homeobox protein siamois-like [Nanorana parkeri]
MDTELDQVLCTVLSLEEDYPTMSPPPRFQDNFFSTPCVSPDGFSATESQTNLQGSITLQEKLLEIYALIRLQQEARAKKSIILKEPVEKEANNQNPLKRKLGEDENEGCKEPGDKAEDLQNGNPYKRYRKRTNYNKEQITFLMNEFERNPYPDFTRRCRIAKITGISEPRIQVWFQNRRARHHSKPVKPQNVQSRQFPTTGDLPNIFHEEYQHLQINGHFQIPEDMWML